MELLPFLSALRSLCGLSGHEIFPRNSWLSKVAEQLSSRRRGNKISSALSTANARMTYAVSSLSLLASLQCIHVGLACRRIAGRLHALHQLLLLKLTHWLAGCCRCSRGTFLTMNDLRLTWAHDSIHSAIGHSHAGTSSHARHHRTHQARHHATTRRSDRRWCCGWCCSGWRSLLCCRWGRSWLWCCPAIGRCRGSTLRCAGGSTAALTRHCHHKTSQNHLNKSNLSQPNLRAPESKNST